jgi:hypothetical protein
MANVTFNWVRDEQLPDGDPRKVGEPGWLHAMMTGYGRDKHVAVNLDAFAQELGGFLLRVYQTAHGYDSPEMGGEAEFGGWWDSFKKGVTKIAKVVTENKALLAAAGGKLADSGVLPGGASDALTRLVAKYRGGDKDAAKQILSFSQDAKTGDKDSAKALDALRTETALQEMASMPVIVKQAVATSSAQAAAMGAEEGESRHLVQSVVTGGTAWMSDAEFGAVAKRAKAKAPSAAQRAATAKRAAAARAQRRPAAGPTSSPMRQMPGTALARPTAQMRPMPGQALRPMVRPMAPGQIRPMAPGQRQQPGMMQQPGYYQQPGMMQQPQQYDGQGPSPAYDDGADAPDDDLTPEEREEVYGPDGGANLPDDPDDAQAGMDLVSDEPGDILGMEHQPDDELAPNHDPLNPEDASVLGEMDNQPDDDLEPNMDPGDDELMPEEREQVFGEPELSGQLADDETEPDEGIEPGADMDNVPLPGAGDLDNLDNQRDADMAGEAEFGGPRKATPAEIKVLKLKFENERLKKAAQMKAAGNSKEKIAQAMKMMQQNAKRNLQIAQQGSKQLVANMRRSAKDNANRAAMKSDYEDQLATLENKLYDRDMAEDKRAALQAQAAQFRTQIRTLEVDDKERAFELESRRLAMEEDRNAAAIRSQRRELPAPQRDDDSVDDGESMAHPGEPSDVISDETE